MSVDYKFFFVLLLVALIFPVSSNASTYYISEDSIDTNDGSKEHPWRTIGHARKQLQEIRNYTDTYPALYWEEVEALDAPPTSAEEPDHPVAYELNQNYPNPFNPVTQIGYSIPEQTHVRLEVYDSIGRQIAVLVNENKSPGRYEVTFDATHLSSGLYLYRLHTDNHTESRRMMLIK